VRADMLFKKWKGCSALRGMLLALWACLLPAAAWASSLLFVTAAPISPGKFRLLAEAAQPYGIKVEVRFIEKLGAVDAGLWAGYDMVFLDAPRDHIQEQIAAKLAPALPALEQSKKPVLWLHTVQPRWSRLQDDLARRLHAYYVNGGRANNSNFFATVEAHLASKPWQAITAPQVFPATAIYHPKAPALVFPDAASYLRWRGPVAPGQPVVAIAFHQQAIAAEQSGLVDDLIARIEAGGGVALAYYNPVMDKGQLPALLAPGGKRLADVLINTQITLNPDGRRADFEQIGIPVIQAMAYRKGSAQAWREDPVGLPLMDVPFYLAQSEYAGVHDIMIAAANDANDQLRPIPEQAAAVAGKALALARLHHARNADKRVAFMFWNYPPGEKNLGASFMNLPTSFEQTLAVLKQQGYGTEALAAETLLERLQRLLRPYYRPGEVTQALEGLLREDLADLLPMATYRQWLNSLPAARRDAWIAAVGKPEQSVLTVRRKGELHFVVPRLKLGNIIILPQPPRGEPVTQSVYAKTKEIYHSSSAAPPHSYMASYLWLRQQFRADALVHFGTHGTQEWLPGKERGLSVFDDPLLALGDVPVIYPYIVDNIGEAVQTKRRGRAVNISHQTPPMAPAGLHSVLNAIHDDLHAWTAQDEGAVKEQLRERLIAAVVKERIDRDMGWSRERMSSEFPRFVTLLHDHLHELAETAQPLGLHTFGRGADEVGRLYTVMMMLGKTYWQAAARHVNGTDDEADEALVADYKKMTDTAPYQLLRQYVVEGRVPSGLPVALKAALEQGRRWHADLKAEGETRALLAALDGRYIPTSYGGDPIKNPDSLPTGRNLYGFDPSRVPSKAAWAAGKEALDKLVAAHREKTGESPRKFTFTLWSVETMRHQGMLEAQALWALGVEPVWDAGGRVVDVRLVPRAQLGRARIDVVLSATGLYRDHFPNTMKQLARAAQLAAQAVEEDDNPVAANSRRIAAQLVAQGWRREAAQRAGETRIYSNASGNYGSGLDDAALATDTWKNKAQGDRMLAELYLRKMQFAFGPDEADWGKSGAELARAAGGRGTGDLNLYAAHLKGTQAAVLARTSNLYGMLTTDDPFQYLGGIATAVRYLDGKAPELFISNLRGSGSGKAEQASAFLAKELATRNFHPGHIEGLMKEGYAGSLQMLDSMNNFTGWTSVAREIVRSDQWQEFVDVYVRDKHQLGLNRWFEQVNPHALAQMMERMIEMARHDYWQPDRATLDELKARYRELARRHDVRSDNSVFQDYVGLSGFGLGKSVPASAAARAQAAAEQPVAPAPPQVRGMQLEQVVQPVVQALEAAFLLAIGALVIALSVGAWRQWRRA
jgi:cobaltochelatase CobN